MALFEAGCKRGGMLLLALLVCGPACAEAAGETVQAEAGQTAPRAPAVASKRPRVAIALSGGGARGLAHVGVFKGLEKLRIPYDCIVGASMGAIAGGTFATGLSVDAAERKVMDADWDAVFADRPRRSDIPYFRKAEDYQPYFDFTVTLQDFKPLTPRNFVGVQNIGLFFRELTGARHADSFDDLPIPFRAIGTDIISGEAVVLDSGTVAEAMRASMTVPGLFPPIEYKGHLLVDGGLARNIPVSTAQELCGDVVIVVNTISPNLKAEQMNSFLNIAEQVINISMTANMNEELARIRPQDVLLVPDLEGFASTEFEKVRDIIARGEQVVEQNADRLRALQVSEAEYAAWRERVEARKPALPVVEKVSMGEMRWVNPEVLSDLLRLEPGELFDIRALHRNIGRVYARGDFEQLTYDLIDIAPGRAALHIRPEERPGRDFLRFGLGLYTDFQGDSRFNALVSLRRAWLNRLDGQWRSDLRIGRDFTLDSEWYQPASLGSELFFAPQISYADQHRDLRFSSETRFEYSYRRTAAALEIGSVFGRFGEVRFGLMHGFAEVESQSGPVISDADYHQGGYTLRSIYDQLDSSYFPHDGTAARVHFFKSSADLGADDSYSRLELQLTRAFSWGRNTAIVNLRGGSSLDTTLPFYDAFGMGGLFNLSAYPPDYYLGEEMLVGGLMLYRQVSELPAFGKGIYGGVALESGRIARVLPGYSPADEAFSGGLFLAADTVLGPFYLLGAVGENHQRSLYLALGVSF